MGEKPDRRSAKMPPLSCSVCGSVWFRLPTFLSWDPRRLPLAGPVTRLSLRHGCRSPTFRGSRESPALRTGGNRSTVRCAGERQESVPGDHRSRSSGCGRSRRYRYPNQRDCPVGTLL